jgi:Fe-S cluster assembly protein SufD
MSVAIEQDNAFLNAFDRFEFGGGGKPDWFVPIRKAAIARFAEMGFPTLRDEEWRFTNIAPIARTVFTHPDGSSEVSLDAVRPYLWDECGVLRIVFVNGRYVEGLSALDGLPRGVVAGSLALALQAKDGPAADHLGRYADYTKEPFTALNTAFVRDGTFMRVPRGVVIAEPIHLIYVTVPGTDPLATHPRNLIIAEENSQFSFVESYVTLGGGGHFTNPVTELIAGPGAVVDHYKVAREDDNAFHVGTLQIQQQRDSNLRSHCLSVGGGLVRHDINVVLAGEGAECMVNGLYMVRGRQHVDNHLYVDHAAPHCTSRENFKGILDDHAHGVFTGRIVVRPGAQKTDGKQSNKNLLLSDDAKVNTKPQLEIFADDVKCTHGATVGQIDRDALFYLRSRGLAEPAARTLLVHAFASESLDEVRIEPLRRRLQTMLWERLPEGRLFEELP